MLQDIRYALRRLRGTQRSLRPHPDAGARHWSQHRIFSVMNGVMLRYLPVRDPQQLVDLNIYPHPNNSSRCGQKRF